jgi:hypothetical protein
MAYLLKNQSDFYRISLDNNNYKELSQIFSGNITPIGWYKEFTTKKGTADLALISVLSEIIYWYRPKRVKDPVTGDITYAAKFLGNAWQTSYEHFQRKMGFNREKLRRIFVKLEQMGICLREFRDVKLRGQIYNNRLFIHLSSSFLDACIARKTNKQISESKNQNISKKPSFFAEKKEGAYPRFRGDHIIDKENKNNIKDRSTKCESNFLENFFEEDGLKENRGGRAFLLKNNFDKAKELKDFYPLTKEDCQILQSSSKREFSLNSMNEILLDMSKRLSNRYFKSKRSFLSYMSKVFAYEMRDAVKINNENFKIKNNQSKKEKEEKLQEEYLTKIEYNLETSQEWHFKKRIAARLPQKTAYELLKAFNIIDIKEGIFNLHLSKHIELTNIEEKLILQEAQSTYEQLDFSDERLGHIQDIKIIMSEKAIIFKNNNQNKAEETAIPSGIWGRARERLIANYGRATDNNWFSKLEAVENTEKNELKLKAPNSFIKDWINQNYFDVIEKLVSRESYKLEVC